MGITYQDVKREIEAIRAKSPRASVTKIRVTLNKMVGYERITNQIVTSCLLHLAEIENQKTDARMGWV